MTGVLYGQQNPEDTLIEKIQVFKAIDLPSDFNQQYRNALRRVRRVYPLALEAARIVDSLDRELAHLDKNREERKLLRQTHRNLKHDFKFLLKDLYISEGKVLIKLIYRETGMTVAEIISKYKSGFQSSIYSGIAGVFEQDLDSKYYPKTEDFILECVVQDIINGKVEFDSSFEILDKEEYQMNKKEYRKQKRKNKKRNKAIAKETKKQEKNKKSQNDTSRTSN